MREALLIIHCGVICREAQKTNNPNPYSLCSKWSTWLCILYGCVKIHVLCTKLRTKKQADQQVTQYPATWDFPKYFFIADCFSYVESNFLGGTTCAVQSEHEPKTSDREEITLISVKHCCTCLCKYNPCMFQSSTCHFATLLVSLLRLSRYWEHNVRN